MKRIKNKEEKINKSNDKIEIKEGGRRNAKEEEEERKEGGRRNAREEERKEGTQGRRRTHYPRVYSRAGHSGRTRARASIIFLRPHLLQLPTHVHTCLITRGSGESEASVSGIRKPGCR